jgi:hypothetical protein
MIQLTVASVVVPLTTLMSSVSKNITSPRSDSEVLMRSKRSGMRTRINYGQDSKRFGVSDDELHEVAAFAARLDPEVVRRLYERLQEETK